MKLINFRYKLLAVCCWLLAMVGSSCSELPSNATMVNKQPAIYPDYIGVTIPANIARWILTLQMRISTAWMWW